MCLLTSIVGYALTFATYAYSDLFILLVKWLEENVLLGLFIFYLFEIVSKIFSLTLMFQGLIPGLILTNKFGFNIGLFFGVFFGTLSNLVAGIFSFYISKKLFIKYKKIYEERPFMKIFDIIMEFEGKLMSLMLRLCRLLPIFFLIIWSHYQKYLWPIIPLDFLELFLGKLGNMC